MNVFYSSKRLAYWLITALTITILSACSTGPSSPDDIPPELFSELNNNSAFYLNKDKLEGDDGNPTWQLLAVQALIEERQYNLAEPVINHLRTMQLTPQQQASLQVLTAQNQYGQSNIDQSQAILLALDKKQLSEYGNIAYLKLQSAIYIQKDKHLAASNTLLLLTPMLKVDAEKQQYNDILLEELSLLPAETLNQYKTTAVTPESNESFKQGWYALGSLYQRFKLRPNNLKRAVPQWESEYPSHPVLAFMPTQLTNIPEYSPYQPKNIAVILPLSGRFSQQGNAVKYGILNAFYLQQEARSQDINSDLEGLAPKIFFYDSSAQTVADIALQTQQQNIDFVIGPLLKNNVETFLPLVPGIPVLALNQFATAKSNAKVASSTGNETQPSDEAVAQQLLDMEQSGASAIHYAFYLSPEDEAQQAAKLISQDNHKNPIIIAPNSAYGVRVASAFNSKWQSLNSDSDQPVEQFLFSNKAELARFIDKVLHTDKSKTRISQMKAITDLSLETEVRSRRDIDAIYLVSKRDELILVKPFLDVSISPFAPKIPLYASSRTHDIDRSKQNNELTNLTFSDMPFLLNDQNEIKQQIQKIWPNQSFTTQRLFALGFDSFQLIEQLTKLQLDESYFYPGLAGELSLDIDNTIQPKLNWAKYYKGKLVEVTTPDTAE